MAFRFFTVPIQNAEQAEAELNGFLRSHKVLSIDRRWVEQGSTSFWTFCVDYIDGQAAGSGADRGSRSKVDYKEVLSPDEFAVFAKLRDVRKEIAQAEAVPVYTIFTNEQLAEMVKARAAAKADLEKIAGLGDARIEKYGARMIEVLTASCPAGGARKAVGERSRASNRVNRGGSWNNDAGNCRAANRNRNTPDNRNNNLGFRLARAPQVERMLCPTEPTAFPVPLPSMCGGQIVTLPPSSAGSKREGSGRSLFA